MNLTVNDISIKVLDIKAYKEDVVAGKKNCIEELKKNLTDKQIEDGLYFMFKMYSETEEHLYKTRKEVLLKNTCYLDVLQRFFTNKQIQEFEYLFECNTLASLLSESDGEKFSILYKYDSEFSNSVVFANGDDINDLVYYEVAGVKTKSYDKNDVPSDIKNESNTIIGMLYK